VAHLLFCQLTMPNKKSKRATKPTHNDTTMDRQTTTEKEERRHNTGLAKVAVQCSSATAETHLWLIKVWFSASTFAVKIPTFSKPETAMAKTQVCCETFSGGAMNSRQTTYCNDRKWRYI